MMEDTQPAVQAGPVPLWLAAMAGVLCVAMVAGYRAWLHAQSRQAINDCVMAVWDLQKAEYRFKQRFKRYGARKELQGANPAKKVYFGAKNGWRTDIVCPVFFLKLSKNKKAFLLTARPKGVPEEGCRILADHQSPPRLGKHCPK